MTDPAVLDYYRHLFAARLDAYSRWTEQGWRPVRGELTVELIEAGLTKQGPALSGFLIAPGNQTHIAAVDFDLEDGAAHAKRLVASMARSGAPAYLEGSRRGAHVWILLESVAPARQVRAALMTWLTEAGGMPPDPNHPGRFDPKIELRPATDTIGDDGLGHALRLPLMPHPKTGQRYRITSPDGEVLGPRMSQILLAMDAVPMTVLAEAAMRWRPKIGPNEVPLSYRPPHAPDNDQSSASELLRDLWGVLDAAPGKVVSCPVKTDHSHGDRNKGCKVFPDDRRVLCHKAGCWMNNDGHGRGTWELRTNAPGTAS